MSLNREANLARNTIIITFGKVCTQFVSFLLLPLYTAALNTEEYGIVDLILTYSSLAFPFITLSIDQSLFRFLIDERNNEKNKSEIISTSIYFVLLQSIVIAIVILVIKFITKKALLSYFLLVLLGTVWSFLSLQLSRGIGDNVGYSIGSALAGIVQVICNIIFLVLFDLGIEGMLLATIAGNFSCTLLLIFRVHILRYMKFKNINIVLLKKMLKYSLPMIPNQLSWWALNASDKVIVQFFLGTAANGILAVSTKFSGVYVQFSNIFNISWTESATLHIKDMDAEVFISKVINKAYSLFMCAGCCIMLFLSICFDLLINEQYKSAYGLIPIFMIASLCNIVVSLYGVIYVAFKQTVEIAKTAVFATVINIVVHLALVHMIGIYAAAISTLAGYGAMAIFRYFHSRRYLIIKFSKQILFLSMIMITISLISYYSGNLLYKIISLFIICLLSMCLNKDIIFAIKDAFIKRIKEIKKP